MTDKTNVVIETHTQHKGSELSEELGCLICKDLTAQEIVTTWQLDHKAMFKAVCKTHKPIVRKRVIAGLDELKKIMKGRSDVGSIQ